MKSRPTMLPRFVLSLFMALTCRCMLAYYPYSPYCYCTANPVNYVDPNGCDTICVNYDNHQWMISKPILSEGPDVFVISNRNRSAIYKYDEGDYGNRILMLNLDTEIADNTLALGVYHVSGVCEQGTGFYITRGGESSNVENSRKRIEDGIYSLSPHVGSKWCKPRVGRPGEQVYNCTILIHYGSGGVQQLLKWTEGCFVVTNQQAVNPQNININIGASKQASYNIDMILGGYPTDLGKYGGAIFENISHQLILKSSGLNFY